MFKTINNIEIYKGSSGYVLYRNESWSIEHDSKGLRIIRKNGIVHNPWGPAVIDNKGNRQWVLNGTLHRECGPALIYVNGSNFWAIKGNSDYQYVDLFHMMKYNKSIKDFKNWRNL